ncbi:hypothetical protein LEP1GSC127_3133 [Leptospira kirschneri str. 200801925]|nr:hypothetical protein LEP1GSC127_3133 [Leptospira kirschneri str. 200801925]
MVSTANKLRTLYDSNLNDEKNFEGKKESWRNSKTLYLFPKKNSKRFV